MTTRHELEERLRKIPEPASASTDHKERLRNDLKQRAAKGRSSRAVVTIVIAIVAFSSTILHETPLESVNSELTTVKITEYEALFKTHEDSKTVIGFRRVTTENGKVVELPLTPDEVETRRGHQGTLENRHAAGMTKFRGITGFEAMNIARISASYYTVIDSTRVYTSEPIRNDPIPEEYKDRFLAFMQERHIPYIDMILEGTLEQLADTELEVDGVMQAVHRFVVQDDDLGEIILYSSY